MNMHECKQVVAKIQLGDNRQVDELVLREWFDHIGHLQFEDAIEAVREHRQMSTDYLTFAHVVGGARRSKDRRARAARVSAAQRELGGAPREDDGGEKRRVKVWRAMLADQSVSEKTKAGIRRSFELEGISE